MTGQLIVDAHEDLAYNALVLGRDYSLSALETRRRESGSPFLAERDNTMLGWQEYQDGRICLVLSTLFAVPAPHASAITRVASYRDQGEAEAICLLELEIYRRIASDHPDKFRIVRTSANLAELLSTWQAPEKEAARAVGLVILMEGAECIRSPDDLEEWWELGVRAIGPAWRGNRFCGGTMEKGPLTREGRELLKDMEGLGFTLDLSHMDEEAALQSLDSYAGPIIASHSNAAALLPGDLGNRHLSDRVIRGLIDRNAVIGVVPYNEFLVAGWEKRDGRAKVSLDLLAAHIDHICQVAGDARHVGLGSDFDGGFGLESVPHELDSVADLQKLAPLLSSRGHSQSDIAAILGGNFLRFLGESLPAQLVG